MTGASETQQLVPSIRVAINGADMEPEAKSDLMAVCILEDVDAPSMFTFRMTAWDMNRLEVKWIDDEMFAEGSEIEIEMGYVNNLEKLISGDITGLEPEFRIEELPQIAFRGYDRRHRLMRGVKTRSFTQVKDSDIASQIASDAGLSGDTVDTSVTYDYVLQHNQTDYEFLKDRANRIGYEVVVEDSTLYFRPRRNAESEVLTLNRLDLLEFLPRLSTLGQAGEVAVRGWDPMNKEAIVAQAAAGDENSSMGGTSSGPDAVNSAFGEVAYTTVDRPVFNQEQADQTALGGFNEMALSYVTGEGLCNGRTDIRAGTVVNIEGIGERFSGLYYITSVRHSYSPQQGYLTAFTVNRTAT